MYYNALKNPNRKWHEQNETEKIDSVVDYHFKKSIELPNEQMHAMIHVVIENQIALLNETPVADAIQRLMKEGIDRHEAIHAVGTILGKYFWNIFNNSAQDSPDEWKEKYFKEVRGLTVKKWHEEFMKD